MSRLYDNVAYWLLVNSCRLIGALPDWILYHPVLDFLYFILYKVVRYRIKVVRGNLEFAFPEKSDAERLEIEKRFYRHLAEVFVDTIDMTNISAEDVKKRMKMIDTENHELLIDGKHWIAALAHYGSWEYFSSYSLHTTSELVVGVYRPLHNRIFDRYFKYVRSRRGSIPLAMNSLLRYVMQHKNEPNKRMALGLIADQSPPFFDIEHWYDFLGRKTPFFMGIEKFALRFGMPVFFLRTRKVDRARYECWFEMIYDGQEDVAEFELTTRYVKKLEQMIREAPEYWMWSHKRWKHNPPSE